MGKLKKGDVVVITEMLKESYAQLGVVLSVEDTDLFDVEHYCVGCEQIEANWISSNHLEYLGPL